MGFKTCRLLSGNVRNRKLTIIQRRILRRLRNKKRSIKRKIYPRENLNSYIQSQTTRKLPLFHGNFIISVLISILYSIFDLPERAFCHGEGEEDKTPNISEPCGSSSEPSGLEQKETELINQNLKLRKTEKIVGQQDTELRQAVEEGNSVQNVSDRFRTVEKLQSETESVKKECPLTNCALNQLKDFQSHVQDGRGGGKPDK